MTVREIAYMPLSTLRSAPRNPKLHDDDGIRSSITRHGIAELPLLDERTGLLVAGHGRRDQLVALQSAGAGAPDGVQIDEANGEWLVPVVRGWSSRSDREAEAYLIGSNKLTMNGGWDAESLSEMLADLAVDGLLDLTGFDEGELSAMLDDDSEPDEMEKVSFDAATNSWDVVVACRNLQEQEGLLARLQSEGFSVKVG